MSRDGGKRQLRTALVLALAVLAGGCKEKTPDGQVVAVVDEEEITRRELAAEPEASTELATQDAQPALAAILNGVIDRKLAVAEARRLELDRTPRYLAQAKRLEEVMLSRTLFDRWAAEMPEPSPQALAAFIRGNPQRFDERKLFLVDRIEAAQDALARDALEPLQTNDAVAAYLVARDIPHARGQTVLDSAGLSLAMYRNLVSVAPGSPIALVQNGRLVVLAVIEAREAPLASTERAAAAAQALKQAAVQEQLAGLRKRATIAYQPGYRPAPVATSAE